jgi:hypothetical protein
MESVSRANTFFDGRIAGRTLQSAERAENLGCLKHWRLGAQSQRPTFYRRGETPPELEWKVIDSSRNHTKIWRTVTEELLGDDFDIPSKCIVIMA